MQPIKTQLISVLVPVYNHEAFLRSALQSIWSQTGVRVEIIAVDDGSSDSSGRILDELQRECPVTMHVAHQPNAGVCSALGRALGLAAGEFLCVLASDDERTPGSLARQAAQLRGKGKEVVGVFGDVAVLGANPEIVISACPPDKRRLIHADMLFWRAGAYLQSGMYRTEAIRRVGGFDPTLSFEDWDLLLRLSAVGELHYHSGVAARYRRGTGGLSTAAKRHERSFLTIAKRESAGLHQRDRRLVEALVWGHLMMQSYANLDLENARRCAFKALSLGDRSLRISALRVLTKTLLGQRTLSRLRTWRA